MDNEGNFVLGWNNSNYFANGFQVLRKVEIGENRGLDYILDNLIQRKDEVTEKKES